MKLDLRLPTLVLSGAWNPEIFTPPWMLKHLYGYEEGVEVKAVQALVASDNEPPKKITYIDQIGISVTKGRLDLFANVFEQADMTRLESVAKKVVSTLLHTPMGALGVNFSFTEEDPSGELADKLKSPDGLEGEFEIKSQSFTAKIGLDESVDLNLTRAVSAESIKFNFNYHCFPLNPGNADQLIDGCVNARYEKTKELMLKLYELDEIELVFQANPAGA